MQSGDSRNNTDKELELLVLKAKLNEFEHTFNPRHFYCRLVEIGADKKIARIFAEQYEFFIYKKVSRHIKKHTMKKYLHQTLINDLAERLSDSCIDYEIIKNMEYGKGSVIKGEIDLYAIHKSKNIEYHIFFEMKCTNSKKNREKARKQLERIKDFFANSNKRCWYFYVTNNTAGDGYSIKRLSI